MMGAVACGDPGKAARRALEAGVDWLLYPPDPAIVHAAVRDALVSGEIDRGRCENAVGRLFELKTWALERRPAAPVGSAAALAEAVAGAALTADPPEPPLGPAWPDRARWIVILDGAIGRDAVVLADELAGEAAERMIFIDTAEPVERVNEGIRRARQTAVDVAVACAVFSPVRAWKGRPGLSALGAAAVEAVCGAASEAVLLNFSNPHIVRAIRSPSRIVWAYGEDPACQRAAVAFLRGALPIAGRLPVRLARQGPQ
jgi:hypothetical protein